MNLNGHQKVSWEIELAYRTQMGCFCILTFLCYLSVYYYVPLIVHFQFVPLLTVQLHRIRELMYQH